MLLPSQGDWNITTVRSPGPLQVDQKDERAKRLQSPAPGPAPVREAGHEEQSSELLSSLVGTKGFSHWNTYQWRHEMTKLQYEFDYAQRFFIATVSDNQGFIDWLCCHNTDCGYGFEHSVIWC